MIAIISCRCIHRSLKGIKLSSNRRVASRVRTIHCTQFDKMVKAQKFILVKHFEGEPKRENVKLVEEELPPLKDGEYLVEAEFLSVDPYMRVYTKNIPEGTTMIGAQVGKIIESKNSDYPVGKRVHGYFGWRTHTVVNEEVLSSFDMKPHLLPDFGKYSPSLGIGALGLTGNTAYFGLLDICSPKKGETLVVTGAAGAVGSHVGQIGKHVIGMKVIGVAGTDEKCKWIVDELGFDHAINYKTTTNFKKALREVAPDGVDCYFDNVGGQISSDIMYQMKPFGRVSVCGSISSYDSDPSNMPKASILQPCMLLNQLKMEGFIVTRWIDRYDESVQKNLQWIREGKVKVHEHVTKGFENMFTAFTEMLKGKNVGKAVVQV